MQSRPNPPSVQILELVTAATFDARIADIEQAFNLRKGALQAVSPIETELNTLNTMLEKCLQPRINQLDDSTLAKLRKKQQALIVAQRTEIEGARNTLISNKEFNAGNYGLALRTLKKNLAILLQNAAQFLYDNHADFRTTPSNFNAIFDTISNIGNDDKLTHNPACLDTLANDTLTQLQQALATMLEACVHLNESAIALEIKRQLLTLNHMTSNAIFQKIPAIKISDNDLQFTKELYDFERKLGLATLGVKNILQSLETQTEGRITAFEKDLASAPVRKAAAPAPAVVAASIPAPVAKTAAATSVVSVSTPAQVNVPNPAPVVVSAPPPAASSAPPSTTVATPAPAVISVTAPANTGVLVPIVNSAPPPASTPTPIVTTDPALEAPRDLVQPAVTARRTWLKGELKAILIGAAIGLGIVALGVGITVAILFSGGTAGIAIGAFVAGLVAKIGAGGIMAAVGTCALVTTVFGAVFGGKVHQWVHGKEPAPVQPHAPQPEQALKFWQKPLFKKVMIGAAIGLGIAILAAGITAAIFFSGGAAGVALGAAFVAVVAKIGMGGLIGAAVGAAVAITVTGGAIGAGIHHLSRKGAPGPAPAPALAEDSTKTVLREVRNNDAAPGTAALPTNTATQSNPVPLIQEPAPAQDAQPAPAVFRK